MNESSSNEKLLGTKSLKKYGSTSKHIKKQEHLVKHQVQPTDTLQGIALKYGVTMEQLRRINKLWASDSLFLKEHLLVPLNTSEASTSQIYVNNNHLKNGLVCDETNCNNKDVNGAKTNEPTIDEFLSSIDHSIANTKKEIKRVQYNSELYTDWEREIALENKRKPAQSRLKQSQTVVTLTKSASGCSTQMADPLNQQSAGGCLYINPNISHYQECNSYQNGCSHTNSNNLEGTGVPLVVTQTGRKLRSTTLQQMQNQHDQLFEL